MSAREAYEPDGRTSPAQVVAGFLATLALFGGLAALIYTPGRVGPAAMLVALIAAAIGGFQSRLAAWALAVATVSWFAGMVVAVLLERPLF